MNRNVFLYWVGYEYKLISILRKLIYLHSKNGKGYKVHLITDKNIKHYVPDLPDYFYNLQPAHQADFVRVNVVCDHGGMWLDSDTLVMDKLDSLFDIIESKKGFFIKENNEILCNGVFGSQAKTPLMLRWKHNMMQIFNVKKQHIGWSEVGCRLLQGIFNTDKTLYGECVIFEGLDNLYPVNYDKCVREFIEAPYENYKKIVREYQPLVILVNSVYKSLESKTEKEIMEGNMPLNYFLNKSFENFGIIKKYIIVTDWLKTYLTKEPLIFCKNLESCGWKIVYLSDLDIDSIKREKAVVLCVTYNDFDISQLKCDNVFIVYKIDDVHSYTGLTDKCIGASNLVIGPYQYLFNELPTNISNVKSLYVPYSAVNEFYEDILFNPNPTNKVLVSGAIVPGVYPLRQYASSLDNTDVLQHPSYNKYEHDLINEKFYKKLNEYICCFTDVSVYKYILLKVFEICSVGSLLLVEDTVAIELNKLGFYDTINCIFCNKDNLEDKIRWVLSPENRKDVDCMRTLGMELVRSTHSTKQRSIEFNDYISSRHK